MMSRVKAELKRLWNDESGMEFFEWAILIVIVAGIAVGAWLIGAKIQDKVEEAGDVIDMIGGGAPTTPTTP